MRPIPPAATALVKRFESCRLQPYMDANPKRRVWTIGWGHVIKDGNGAALEGEACREKVAAMFPSGITQQEADGLLVSDMEIAAEDVERLVKAKLSDNEFAALISWLYNEGNTKEVRGSVLLKLLNLGNKRAAADLLTDWIYSGGVILKGLVRRRVAERDLFLGIA